MLSTSEYQIESAERVFRTNFSNPDWNSVFEILAFYQSSKYQQVGRRWEYVALSTMR